MSGELCRLELLLGQERISRLRQARVLVCGVGGVGGWCAEALARSGVGSLTMLDDDVVKPSNLNRQLCALHSTLGQLKVKVLEARLKDIAPTGDIQGMPIHLTPGMCRDFLSNGHFDCVVDAIDEREPKLALLAGCVQLGIPVVSSMGAGNKLEPTQVQVADISQSHGCPLARSVRQALRKLGIERGIRVVFSAEPMPSDARLGKWEEGRHPVGSCCMLPAVFGLTCASEVVQLLSR